MRTFGLTDCISRGPLHKTDARWVLNCTSIIELHCKTDWLTLPYKVVADHPWRPWLPQASLKGNWPRISYPVDLKGISTPQICAARISYLADLKHCVGITSCHY